MQKCYLAVTVFGLLYLVSVYSEMKAGWNAIFTDIVAVTGLE